MTLRSTGLLLPIALLVAALAAGAARADLQVRELRTDAKGGPAGERMLAVSGNRLRIDDGDAGFVIDVGSGKVIWLDHAAKTWRESMLPAARARERDAGDPSAAEWRRRSDLMLVEMQRNAPLRLVPSSETRSVAGMTARRTDVFVGERKVRERWMAEALPVKEIGALVGKLVERSPSLLRLAFVDEFMKTAASGYPVLVRDLERGTTLELKEVRKDALPAALFAAPATYRKSE